MSEDADNVQETTDSTVDDQGDNAVGKGANPFRAKATTPPHVAVKKATEPVEDEPEEEPPAEKPAAKTGSTLDDIDDVTVLRKMVKETRREAAKARTEKNAELKEFEAWKDAQKTEAERAIEKATARAKAAEDRADELLANNLRLEFNVSDELAEFITGDSEDEMRARAEKLRDTKPKAAKEEKEEKEDKEEKVKVGLLGGKRGEPLSKAPETTNDWFTKLMRES
jgi:hypothetical protein